MEGNSGEEKKRGRKGEKKERKDEKEVKSRARVIKLGVTDTYDDIYKDVTIRDHLEKECRQEKMSSKPRALQLLETRKRRRHIKRRKKESR